MKIKEVKVELVDEDSRFVIKRIITDKGEFFIDVIDMDSRFIVSSQYAKDRKNYTLNKVLGKGKEWKGYNHIQKEWIGMEGMGLERRGGDWKGEESKGKQRKGFNRRNK